MVVPRGYLKNIIDFCGKPLLAWSIQQALDSSLVNEVYVSTDDTEIAAVAKKYGAQVIKRPEEISGDTAKSEDALKHVIVEVQKIIPPRLITCFFASHLSFA